jgi:two-component system CheB/CheR fusion protein
MNKKKDNGMKGMVGNSSKFLYVGIGASAGGLDAIKKFLSNVPEKSGMCYIIVQHMDPTHKSGLVNILSRYTTMNVLQVEDGVVAQPDRIYIIPPNKDMGMLEGKLELLEPIEPHGLRMPINYFFSSLAQDQQDKCVGIVLSGFGSDGSIGLKAIKANGGICVAQDPSTAGSDAMPTNAINTGLVDMILAPEDMPGKLISYTKSSHKILKKILTPEDETLQALSKIFILIRNRTGHDFSQYKKSTVYRRIGRRMNIHQIDNMHMYLKYLQENPHEIDLLFKEFLINVTNFFRNAEAFESLKNGVLKEIIEAKSDFDILRVWIPGCSSGEEVYSIAIIIRELLDETNKKLEVQIFGTDLDSDSIKTARSGTYSHLIQTDVSHERIQKFFNKNDNEYSIKNEIRDMVVFATHNIIKDPPFTRLDFISCRNLLIYLESDVQEKVLSNFNYALKKDGILFLGPSESIGEFIDAFSAVDKKWKIFKNMKSDSLSLNYIKNHSVQYQRNSHIYWESKFGLKESIPQKVNNDITELAEKKLMDIFTPPSALINDMGEILYIHGRLGNYLEPSPGKAHMNIYEMSREGIKLDLSSAIQSAITNKRKVLLEGLEAYNKDGNKHFIKLIVKPLQKPESLKGLLIVSFEESSVKSHENNDINIDPLSKESEHIKALETELKNTKEKLSVTVEEMTTSNEELKSANEELQSMNEESQSTNEELETSKEELQSINEELTTVNNELQIKIDEMSKINDDMNNLFNSTEIATVFVDNDIKIRRFTKEATKLIKLIKSDIGRPLSDIVSNLKYPRLEEDILEVIDTIISKNFELETDEGEWYQTRIMPYKTSKNVIDGAVITFTNISQRKKQTTEALKLAETIIETARDPILILDKDIKIFSANSSFYEMYKVKPEDTLGKSFFNIGEGQWDIPKLRKLIEEILPENTIIKGYIVEENFPTIGTKKIIVNARQIYQQGIKMILMAMNEE